MAAFFSAITNSILKNFKRKSDKPHKNTKIASVVDNHPRFFCESVLWVLCLQRFTRFHPRIYFANCRPPNLGSWMLERGVEVETMKTLIKESPHCNKIVPFQDFGTTGGLVTDCDVFVLKDFQFMLNERHVRLPQNNNAIPPFKIFSDVLNAYGFQPPYEPGMALFSGSGGRETFSLNVSCGVIWIPAAHIELVKCWKKMAKWLVANRSELGPYGIHIDQVGMVMALYETGTPFSHLAPHANAVLQILPEIGTLYALHITSGHLPFFPQFFTDEGMLNVDSINAGLAADLCAFNEVLAEAKSIISDLAETSEFAENFINPKWKR